MPTPEIVPPRGYRNAIPPRTTSLKSAMKPSAQTTASVHHKRKTSKQVSEYGDRDATKQGKSAKADQAGGSESATNAGGVLQVEEKMQTGQCSATAADEDTKNAQVAAIQQAAETHQATVSVMPIVEVVPHP